MITVYSSCYNGTGCLSGRLHALMLGLGFLLGLGDDLCPGCCKTGSNRRAGWSLIVDRSLFEFRLSAQLFTTDTSSAKQWLPSNFVIKDFTHKYNVSSVVEGP